MSPLTRVQVYFKSWSDSEVELPVTGTVTVPVRLKWKNPLKNMQLLTVTGTTHCSSNLGRCQPLLGHGLNFYFKLSLSIAGIMMICSEQPPE
jgi:hypothetical protein